MIGQTVGDAAREYTRRGMMVLPIPHRSKSPRIANWQKMRIKEDDLGQHFNGKPRNIGVLLGEPSGWLIDIDLDHQRAVELADRYLPPTEAIFGRNSNRRSHRIYRVSEPMKTKKFNSKSAGMLVEIRSTGLQTVFPPSTHESGEAIFWEGDNPEPSTVDPEQLLKCVKRLADAVKKELGETKPVVKTKKRAKSRRKQAAPTSRGQAGHSAACLASMLRIGITDQNDGSRRLFAAACRVVEFDLDDRAALSTIREYARRQRFPKEWTDEEILQRIRDAEKKCRRGQALEVDSDGYIPLGGRDPKTGRVVLSPKKTLPTAESYVHDFHLHPSGCTLHNYAGQLLEWRDNRYVQIEDAAVKKRMQEWLHWALRYVRKRNGEGMDLADFESNPTTVNAALESLRNHTHLASTVKSPSWLGEAPNGLPVDEILPCRSTLLHLPTMEHISPTPQFFTLNALEFDPDPSAPEPKAWFAFLRQLFGDDRESRELLQQWFGYCLTGDTSQQKILLVVGPKRSGKGTIARVLTRLIGQENVSGPTTSSLAGSFGLQPLIGKNLAIVSDARFRGNNISTVVERLLCISGEDTLTIDRKYNSSVTMKLPVRFMFLTNEFPRASDPSGALPNRFLVLKLTRSFYGNEDTGLTDRLLSELPGILNWAIEGWRDLREWGNFEMPTSVLDVVQEIEELSSPVAAFVRENCVVKSGGRVSVDELYLAWTSWSAAEGRQFPTTRQTFGRDLSSAFPSVERRRGTGQQSFYDGIAIRGQGW